MMEFDTLEEHLSQRKTPSTASELHGLLTGWFSAGSTWTPSEQAGVLSRWIGDEPVDDALAGLISTLAIETFASLQEQEFGFQLLLPDDNVMINVRSRALSHWCAGFLSGFGMTGRFQQADLEKEVAEVMGDFAQISKLTDEVPEAEENESDLMEISEYVRMSALLVYTECTKRSIH
jgi:hypothetical protein